MPARKPNRITNFRCWEQAFRIYATIYCGANPSRAREIWQYISIINMASTAYVWDNVYNYDVIFRQLMQFNPNRSWAITYNHMWNLSMRMPLPNKLQNFSRQGFPLNNRFNSSSNHSNSGNIKKKSDYCWNFNKGIKCKFGNKCRFVKRCSYCDSGSHGVYACNKLNKKDSETMSKGQISKHSNRTSLKATENETSS